MKTLYDPIIRVLRGHPMDLFLKISLLQAIVCSLGEVKKVICPWKESVAGKRQSRVCEPI